MVLAINQQVTAGQDGEFALTALPFSTLGRVLPGTAPLANQYVNPAQVVHWSYIGPIKSFRYDQLHEITGGQIGTPVQVQVEHREGEGFLRLSGIAWRPEQESMADRLSETESALSRFWGNQEFYFEGAQRGQLARDSANDLVVDAWNWFVGDGGALERMRQQLVDTWESVGASYRRADRWLQENADAIREARDEALTGFTDPLNDAFNGLADLAKQTYFWLLLGAVVLLVAYNKSK